MKRNGKRRIFSLLLSMMMLLTTIVSGSGIVYAQEQAGTGEEGGAPGTSQEETAREPVEYDFSEWITSAVLMVKNSDGEYEEVTDQTVAKDAEARMEIEYKAPEKVDSKDFVVYPGDTFTYTLPDEIKIQTKQEGTVYDGADEIGTYEISEEGVITIALSEDFLTEDGRTGILGMISFDGKLNLQAAGSSEETTTITIGDITLEVTVEPEKEEEHAGIKVEKSHTEQTVSRNAAARLKYQVTITADDNNTMDLTGITASDAFSDGKDYIAYDTDSLSFDNTKAPGVTDVTAVWDNENKKVDFRMEGTMEKGDVLVLTYCADVDDSVYSDGMGTATKNGTVQVSKTIKNTVSVSTEEDASANASDSQSFSKLWFKKTGTVQSDGSIRYVIYANGDPVQNLKGWTFRDTLDENQKFDAERDLTVTKYKTSAAADEDTEGTAYSKKETIQLTGNQKYWEYTETEGAYYYIFEYYTIPTAQSLNTTISNTLELYKDSGGTPEGSTALNVGYSIYSLSKTLSGYDLESGTLNWTTTLKNEKKDIFSDKEMESSIPKGAVYTDTLSVTDGGEHWFEEDSLDLSVKESGNDSALEEGEDYTLKQSGSHFRYAAGGIGICKRQRYVSG